MAKEVKPYEGDNRAKKEQVANMFDSISKRYDLLNHLLSLNIDKGWRKKVVRSVEASGADRILDVATGTADLAIALSKTSASSIVGIDISRGMLDMGQKKIDQRKLNDKITLQQADSEDLPFEENSFDAATVAFGVRNFENLQAGLREIHRVLKKDGKLLVLEFSQPQSFPFKQIYTFYFKRILPGLGRLISKDGSAYTYLPASVDAFPYGEAFMEELRKAGFEAKRLKALTFGVATLYEAVK